MIHLFWHIAAMQEWRWIYERQWKLLQESGLYAAAQGVTLGVVNFNADTHLLPEITRDPKCTLHTHPDREQFEYFTLGLLKHWCDAEPDNHQVWYFHTKGATTSTNPFEPKNPAHHWKEYMEYWSLTRWRDCAEALKAHDLCGVEWRPVPAWHFSGNFWQANSHYIKRLPFPAIPANRWDRVQAELWVGQAKPKVQCFRNFGHDMYRVAITPDLYEAQP